MAKRRTPGKTDRAARHAVAEHSGAKHGATPHDHGTAEHDQAEHGGVDHGSTEHCCCPTHGSGQHGSTDTDLNAWPEASHDQMTFAEPARFAVPSEMVNRVSAFTRTRHLQDLPSSGASLGGVEHAAVFAGSGTKVTIESPVFREPQTLVDKSLVALLRAKPRKNQAHLTDAEKRDFNQAVSMAIDAGRWEWFTDIHSGNYLMHSFMNPPFPAPPLGTYRFLPWHRVYLYRMEVWLNFFMPGVTIPYWDWANDRALPSWVLLPTGITRGPDATRVVATQAKINQDVLSRSDYTSFTQNLEGAHNTVHMFVGGNTMPNPLVSPRDPLFFLHHANVDRIWAQWQETPGRPEAPLTGTDALMTPFTNYHLSGTRDTFAFGYYYE